MAVSCWDWARPETRRTYGKRLTLYWVRRTYMSIFIHALKPWCHWCILALCCVIFCEQVAQRLEQNSLQCANALVNITALRDYSRLLAWLWFTLLLKVWMWVVMHLYPWGCLEFEGGQKWRCAIKQIAKSHVVWKFNIWNSVTQCQKNSNPPSKVLWNHTQFCPRFGNDFAAKEWTWSIGHQCSTWAAAGWGSGDLAWHLEVPLGK